VTWEAWDMRYIAGVYATVPSRWGGAQYLVLPRNGDPYVFAFTTLHPEGMREEMPWLKGKIFMPQGNSSSKMVTCVEDVKPFMDTVLGIISDHGLNGELVGLDACPSPFIYEEAFKKAGFPVCDAGECMFRARAIKNIDEINCVRMASAISEAAFYEMQKAIKPGIRECEVLAIGMETLFKYGCDETQEFVLASGPRINPLHCDYTDRIIRPGDSVAIDVNAASYNGYKTCYYRTFKCGRATQEEKDNYEIARKMMYDGMAKMKAGNSVNEVIKVWPQSADFWGYGWIGGLALAHGIGISLHEYPMFGGGRGPIENAPVFEEGMVIAIETYMSHPGLPYGARLEECVAITKDGYDLLTKYPVNTLLECY